jgi:hypothetical protein
MKRSTSDDAFDSNSDIHAISQPAKESGSEKIMPELAQVGRLDAL